MSKPEPPPLPQNVPPQFTPPPPPPQGKAVPQTFVEYIAAFDKPLTKDEKVAWLGELAHRVLNGELPQEVYPFLRDKIESLPEAIPNPNRQAEKIPGSDYIHPEGSKSYVPFVRENPTFISDDLRMKPRTYRSTKESDSSFSTLIRIIAFFIVCFIAYGFGSWYMKSPSKENGSGKNEIASVEPVSMEVKTDNPFEEIATDNPFEEPAQEIKTGNPFADDSLVRKFYRVEGKNLLDPNGKPVRLRGVLTFSFHLFKPEDIQDLKNMGVNCVVYAVELEYPNDRYKQGSFGEKIVDQIKMFTDAGIGVIVSQHGRRNWNVDYRPYENLEFQKELLAGWKEIIDKHHGEFQSGSRQGVFGPCQHQDDRKVLRRPATGIGRESGKGNRVT